MVSQLMIPFQNQAIPALVRQEGSLQTFVLTLLWALSKFVFLYSNKQVYISKHSLVDHSRCCLQVWFIKSQQNFFWPLHLYFHSYIEVDLSLPLGSVEIIYSNGFVWTNLFSITCVAQASNTCECIGKRGC